MKLFKAGMLLMLAPLFAACGSSSPAGGPDAGPNSPDAGQPIYSSGSTCPTNSTLTYANIGESFFTTYCTSCHSSTLTGNARQGAPSGFNYDTLAGIKQNAATIDSFAAGGPTTINTEMPQGGSTRPSDAIRKQLGEWLACGEPM